MEPSQSKPSQKRPAKLGPKRPSEEMDDNCSVKKRKKQNLKEGPKRPSEEMDDNRSVKKRKKQNLKEEATVSNPMNALMRLNQIRPGLQYYLLGQWGLSRAPWTMAVDLDGTVYQASGSSKKTAKRHVALKVLQAMGYPTSFDSDLVPGRNLSSGTILIIFKVRGPPGANNDHIMVATDSMASERTAAGRMLTYTLIHKTHRVQNLRVSISGDSRPMIRLIKDVRTAYTNGAITPTPSLLSFDVRSRFAREIRRDTDIQGTFFVCGNGRMFEIASQRDHTVTEVEWMNAAATGSGAIYVMPMLHKAMDHYTNIGLADARNLVVECIRHAIECDSQLDYSDRSIGGEIRVTTMESNGRIATRYYSKSGVYSHEIQDVAAGVPGNQGAQNVTQKILSSETDMLVGGNGPSQVWLWPMALGGQNPWANFRATLKTWTDQEIAKFRQAARIRVEKEEKDQQRQHKMKRLVPGPNSYFMELKCQEECRGMALTFSHAQTVIRCPRCLAVMSVPTGGKSAITSGCMFRRLCHSDELTAQP